MIFCLLAAVANFTVRADAAPEFVDGIMAVVHTALITSMQVEMTAKPEDEMLLQEYGYTSETFHRKSSELHNSIFTNMIEKQLVLRYFQTITNKINESLLDQIVSDEIHENRKYGDRVQLAKDLERQGMTFEDFRRRIKEDLIIRELIHENVPEPIISPRRIEAYYQQHRDDYKLADQIKMRMIVLNKGDSPERACKRGEEILTQIKGGASFAEMASVNSEGSQRKDGGETGWEDLTEVNQALVKEINKLKPGEYSGVIETSDAYFLLLLEDRHAAHIKPLSEVRDDVERTLKNQESERLRKRWLERLRTKTYVGTF